MFQLFYSAEDGARASQRLGRPSVTELHLQLCRLVTFKGHTGHLKSEMPSVPLTVSHEASACTVWELVCFKAEGLCGCGGCPPSWVALLYDWTALSRDSEPAMPPGTFSLAFFSTVGHKVCISLSAAMFWVPRHGVMELCPLG